MMCWEQKYRKKRKLWMKKKSKKKSLATCGLNKKKGKKSFTKCINFKQNSTVRVCWAREFHVNNRKLSNQKINKKEEEKKHIFLEISRIRRPLLKVWGRTGIGKATRLWVSRNECSSNMNVLCLHWNYHLSSNHAESTRFSIS